MLNLTNFCLILGLALVSALNPSVYCFTSKNKPGVCVSQKQCATGTKSPYCRGLKDDKGRFVCCDEETNKRGLNQLNDKHFCGKFSNLKITGGTEVDIHSRPWMALLLYQQHNGIIEPKCGGTLISKSFVLTAAHCINMRHHTLKYVRLAEHNFKEDVYCKYTYNTESCESPHEEFGIKNTIIHERYILETYQDDIALIELDRIVEFKDIISPICLPMNQELQRVLKNQNDFYVAGWGYNKFDNMSETLQEVKIVRRSMKECLYWKKNGELYEIMPTGKTQFCAGSRNADSCKGDSGSPIYFPDLYLGTQRMIQYGIVSYGLEKCHKSKPGVNINVVEYIPWISRNVVT